MMEIEIMLHDIDKLIGKEKSIRNKVLLHNARDALKEYERATRKD